MFDPLSARRALGSAWSARSRATPRLRPPTPELHGRVGAPVAAGACLHRYRAAPARRGATLAFGDRCRPYVKRLALFAGRRTFHLMVI
jgi:hypothetical protein